MYETHKEIFENSKKLKISSHLFVNSVKLRKLLEKITLKNVSLSELWTVVNPVAKAKTHKC